MMICWARRSRRGRNRTGWVASTAARTTSTVFGARKTSRPMPSPRGRVMPGALNFSGVSRNQWCLKEGDGQHHAEPHERRGRADDLSGCRYRSRSGGAGRWRRPGDGGTGMIGHQGNLPTSVRLVPFVKPHLCLAYRVGSPVVAARTARTGWAWPSSVWICDGDTGRSGADRCSPRGTPARTDALHLLLEIPC